MKTKTTTATKERRAVDKHRRALRLRDVMAKTGMHRSTIYSMMAKGLFPKSAHLYGQKCVAWDEREIDAWLDAHFAARDAEKAEREAATAA